MKFITSTVTVVVTSIGMLSTVTGYACGPPGNQCFPVEHSGCYTPYSTYEGKPIIGYDGYTEGASGKNKRADSSACDCSEACYNTPGCAFSLYDGSCSLGVVGAGCYTTTVAGVFWTGKDTDASIGQFLNGPCGHLVFNGTSDN